MSNSLDIQSIYEIFKACRLCGAAEGYRMPIITSVFGFDCTPPSDVEMRLKIRECVQIEVSDDDRMPPLICELCMDKVNDFYDFLEICRQTNNRTRTRLGLPAQIVSRGPSDAGDCKLEVTEPVHTNDDTDTLNLKTMKKEKIVNKQSDKNEKEKYDKTAKEKQEAKDRRQENRIKFLMKEIEDLKRLQELGSSRSSRKFYREARSSESRSSSGSSRTTKARIPSPPPVRETRATFNLSDDVMQIRVQPRDTNVNEKPKMVPTKSILKKEKHIKKESSDDDNSCDNSAQSRGLKRPHEKMLNDEVPSKQRRIAIKLPSPPKFTKPGPRSAKPGPISSKPGPVSSKPGPVSSKPGPVSSKSGAVSSKPGPVSSKPGPRSSKPGPVSSKPDSKSMELSPSPRLPVYLCEICSTKFKACGGLTSHRRHMHLVKYTDAKLACNACGLWFGTEDDTAAHHERHRVKRLPYHCRRCAADFKTEMAYQEHIDKKQCAPSDELPDVKCPKCWKFFPTSNLMNEHSCAGQGARPGDCKKCGRSYMTQKSLKKHESSCKARNTKAPAQATSLKKSELQVRTTRCDALLGKKTRNHYDVSSVKSHFGLDRNCVYPYLFKSVRVKPEPLEYNGMVRIIQDVKDETYKEEDYVHWDSDLSSDSDDKITDQDKPVITGLINAVKHKKVASLTKLSLKTLFSNRCLGKVPRKLRKMKSDNFDLMQNNDFENISDSISNILNVLNDDFNNDDEIECNDKAKDTVSCDSESLLDQDRSIIFNDINDTINDKASDSDVNVLTENDSTNVEPMDATDTQNTIGTDSSEQSLSEDKEKYSLIVENSDLQNIDATDQDNASKVVDFKDISNNCITESEKVNEELVDIAKDGLDKSKPETNGDPTELVDISKDGLDKTKPETNGDPTESVDITTDGVDVTKPETNGEPTESVDITTDGVDVTKPETNGEPTESVDITTDGVDVTKPETNGEPTEIVDIDKNFVDETNPETNGEPTDKSNQSGVTAMEFDDERLMEEIDARINDSTEKEIEKRSLIERGDKIRLDDLVSNNFDKNSLGLESISDDEFNFDA